SDPAAEALAASPFLGNLHTLSLATNRIGNRGVRALAHSRCLPRLTALNLGYNRLDDAGASALASSPLFGQLTALHLAGNSLDPARLEAMRREFRGILGGGGNWAAPLAALALSDGSFSGYPGLLQAFSAGGWAWRGCLSLPARSGPP